MITATGPRVVEFNCRFGDPECQAILPRLDQDLLPLLEAVAAGRGLPASLAWRREASVCVVAASGGYPGAYDTGVRITGVEEAGRLAGVVVFHAGTARRDGALVTAGGRVLGVQALGGDIGVARDRAYEALDRIAFPGMHARRDIAGRAFGRA
jgi:phosphoribosylamine--glycine ligase